MPTLNFGAMQPVADNTGLSNFLESSLPPSSSDGLANPNKQQQQPAAPVKDFLKSFQDNPPAPALPQPLKVNFKLESESLIGKDVITNFLNKLNAYSDENIAFQDLVNEYDQQSFDTPGGVNPKMNEYMDQFENPLLKEARYLLQHPNDDQRNNGPNGFYGILNKMAKTIRPSPPAVAPSAAEPSAAEPESKPWYKFWGGRKTARNRSRNRSRSRSRSGKKTRARKLKQRSRKRVVRRR